LHVSGIAFAAVADRARRIPLTRITGAAIAVAGLAFLHGVFA
jgi:urease accessory protein